MRRPTTVASCLAQGLAWFFRTFGNTRLMAKGGWVTIMANRFRGGTYVGVTVDVLARVYRHREGIGSAHVSDFDKTRLVYAESHEEIEQAIAREKQETHVRPARAARRSRSGVLTEIHPPDEFLLPKLVRDAVRSEPCSSLFLRELSVIQAGPWLDSTAQLPVI